MRVRKICELRFSVQNGVRSEILANLSAFETSS